MNGCAHNHIIIYFLLNGTAKAVMTMAECKLITLHLFLAKVEVSQR